MRNEVLVLAQKFEKVIKLLEAVVANENFPAYRSLLKDYQKARELLMKSPDFPTLSELNILDSTRRLEEAPPKDEILGGKLLDEMSDAVKYARQLFS